ncbi:MAG: hypothetical protein ACOH1U_07895 [Rhodoglobus sp.]
MTGVEALEIADDAFVVLCAVRAVVERLLVSKTPGARFPGIGLFVCFGLVGVISGVLRADLTLSVLASGAFLATKMGIFGWSVAQFDWNSRDVQRVFRVGGIILAVIIVSAILNGLAPALWSSVFSVSGGVIFRYGLPSLSGIFTHPFDLAFACSMGLIAVLGYRAFFGASRATTFLLVGSALATVLSFRRKDLLGMLVASIGLAISQRNIRTILLLSLLLPFLLIVGWSEIASEIGGLFSSYFTVDSREARTVLALGSITLANEYFPFGAGFGRFASRTAATNYSPEYVRLGINHTYGLGSGATEGAFLTDTSWPAILGEAGYFGLAAIVILLLLIGVRSARWKRTGSTPELRMVGLVTQGWLILTVIQSTGAAVFSSPPMFAFLFGLVGMGAALERSETNSDRNGPKVDGTTRRGPGFSHGLQNTRYRLDRRAPKPSGQVGQ